MWGYLSLKQGKSFHFRKVLIPNMIENKFIFKASGIFSLCRLMEGGKEILQLISILSDPLQCKSAGIPLYKDLLFWSGLHSQATWFL